MGNNAVSHQFLTDKLAGLVSSVNELTPTDGNVEITAFDIPYAYYTLDVTATPAPPALPRARSWRVEFVGPLMGSYNYRRYFYLSSADSQLDDPSLAIAAWVIDAQRMFFEYLENGSVVKTVDLTDTNGNVLIEQYRPIQTTGTKWFFGPNHGTSAFPDSDNVRSIIDLDIDALNTILGNSFDLSTNAKQIVNAINEVYAMYKTYTQVFTTDESSPANLVGNPGDIAITPYGIYTMKFKISTGFVAASTDPRFTGIWTNMGVNTSGTISGSSSNFIDIDGVLRNTNWYLHESGNYVLVWSNYNANPSIPRAGYWFINYASTPKLDSGAIYSRGTSVAPSSPTTLPPSGSWEAGFSITWSSYTGSEPSGMDWVLHYQLRTTQAKEIFIGDTQMAIVPMPPPIGAYSLKSVDGVLQWVT